MTNILKCVRKKRKIYDGGQIKDVYMAELRKTNTVSFEDICKNVEHACSATEGDILLVTNGLQKEIMFNLTQGKTVSLGKYGTFYPRVHSKTHSNKKDVKAESITSITCGFRIPKKMQQEMSECKIHITDGVNSSRYFSNKAKE